MSLSDLQVFQEYAQSAATEMQDQQVQKFNGASAGTFILRSAAHSGDFSEFALWGKIANLVRRRNSYGAGAVAMQTLQQLLDRSVKVAAGTPPVEINPGMLKWIQKSPEEAGVIIGKQLAEDKLSDMLNLGLRVYVAAVGQNAALVHDGTAATASLAALNTGASKFGDRSQAISAWFMHSKCLFDLYGTSLANANQLFQFGNVKIIEDGFGRPLIITDSPDLVTAGVPDTYHICGISSGGILIDENNDFTSNVQTTNGDENILRTYQAEWSYNVALKGFKWDSTNGGKSPNDTALGTATNWDQFLSSDKDTAGVLVNVQ